MLKTAPMRTSTRLLLQLIGIMLLTSMMVSRASSGEFESEEVASSVNRVFGTATAPLGKSLAGSKGDVRNRVMFTPGMTGGCVNMFKAYVAAAGHSAYASTPLSWGTGLICGGAFNVRSQSGAEKLALKRCESGFAKFKKTTVTTSGNCEIQASK